MPTIGTRPWYKDWFSSPFYHKLYFERDEEEAKNFIYKLIAFIQPQPGCRMLDAACGRGRYTRILAEAGFDVTGFDLSFESIKHAKQFQSPNLEFYQHDMRFLFRTNYYDCVFNFFTSFGYFATRREHDDAIRSFAAALKPEGLLVIDYLNVHWAEDHLVHQETKNISGTVFDINRWGDETHFYKKIVISDLSLPAPEEHTERVAKFSLGDFTDMLAFQNLQIVEVFGDYRLIPYDDRKTPRMIIVAKKKGDERLSEQDKRLYSDGRSTDALT
jgi:SAM-dependent methyltransferase